MMRLVHLLRSLVFAVVFFIGTFFLVLGVALGSFFGKQALRRMVHIWTGYHRWCTRWIVGIRLRIEGQLPATPVLVAVKHEAMLEAIEMPNLVRLPAVFTKAELMRLPLWGRFAAQYGLVAVERDQGARALRAMLAAARERLAEGRSLVIFPEGTRVPHGQRPPLQSGFAGLYKLLGLPVVPAAVDSGPLYHGLIKHPGTITVRYGEPIPPGLPREEIEARVHAAINALNPGESA